MGPGRSPGGDVVSERAGDRLAYQPALDGLRAVAVVAVLVFHAGFGWAQGGWLGVSTFFTLSGFLITTILLQGTRQDPPVPLRLFWARRARRLLPAAWLTLAGVLVFGATVADATQLSRLRGDVLAALAYVANWRFVFSGESYAELFRSPSPVLHFWSLAIEEQFYFLYPAALLGVLYLLHRSRRGRRAPRRDVRLAAVLAAGAVTSTIWLAIGAEGSDSFDRLYYGTGTRMAELLTGAVLGALVGARPVLVHPGRRRVAGALGLPALAILVVAYSTAAIDERWVFRGGLQVVALLGATVVLAALQPGSLVQRTLSWEPLRRLGLVSYGVYLFHWPIFLWLQGEGWSDVAVLLGGGALTVSLAVASYHWMEQPIRSKRLLADPTARVAAPALALVVLVGATVIVTADPPTDPLAVLAAAEEDASQTRPPPTTPPTTGPAKGAAKGDTAPPRPARVMVVGDSVSWFLGDGIERWAKDDGSVVAWNTGTFGCGIARGGELLLSTGPAAPEARCDDWRARWGRPLAEFDPDVVVVLTGLWDLADRRLPGSEEFHHVGEPAGDAYLVDEYVEAVDLLSAEGAEVVWLTAPCYSEVIFPGPLAETNALEPERQAWLNSEVLPALVAERPQVELVDLAGFACPEGRFTPELLEDRFDGVHFTDEAALDIADWLMPKVVSAEPN
jgi:peptidoglycan/LPS O-acetylase OafA/YrhL